MTVGAIRPPAAAGTFYPEDRAALVRIVDRLLAESAPWSDARPWGIVVPHAGYRYSGQVASSAYAAVRACRAAIARVVVVGPAHFVPLDMQTISLLGQGLTRIARYMTYGGTIWGNQLFPCEGTHYDFGAPIRDAISL